MAHAFSPTHLSSIQAFGYWAAKRLALYVAAGVGGVIVFSVVSLPYVYFSQSTVLPAQKIEQPLSPSNPNVVPAPSDNEPKKDDLSKAALVASVGRLPGTVIGAPIVSPWNEPLGEVVDVVLRQGGQADALIVRPANGWTSNVLWLSFFTPAKPVAIPYDAVVWRSELSSGASGVKVKGVTSYFPRR